MDNPYDDQVADVPTDLVDAEVARYESTMWDHEAIHLWFSLSYANYLVLPRSILQSMPDEWQKSFVLLLNELDEQYGHLETPPYEVRVLARSPELITHEECPECEGGGTDLACAPCEECGGEGDVECDARYETAEEVGFRDDPIPHYNRGRTRILPRRETDGNDFPDT